MNQPISPGFNKHSNLLGKINPKCVLSYIYPVLELKTTQIGCFPSFLQFPPLVNSLKEIQTSGKN